MKKPNDPETIKRNELNDLPKPIVDEIQKDEFERDNPTSPVDEAPIR